MKRFEVSKLFVKSLKEINSTNIERSKVAAYVLFEATESDNRSFELKSVELRRGCVIKAGHKNCSYVESWNYIKESETGWEFVSPSSQGLCCCEENRPQL
jgi:hypothetical protein